MVFKESVFFFDVDGLLLDSERVYLQFWIEAASQNGFILSRDRALQLRSLDSNVARSLFFDWFGSYESYDVIRSTRKEMMIDYLGHQKYSLKSGAIELLSFLKQKNVLMYVVTSNDRKKASELLKQYSLYDYFKNIISTKDIKRGKPFPDVYCFAKNMVNLDGVNANHYVAIEDSPNGVISAHKSGCFTIMIPDLTQCDKSLQKYTDLVVPSLLHLKKMLEENELKD